ncbi:hypothetical protein J6590_024528 [Homalodisca vitripennis]|nr:hypothetical protein J6590_024528 [Homalodisca vitripennis]
MRMGSQNLCTHPENTRGNHIWTWALRTIQTPQNPFHFSGCNMDSRKIKVVGKGVFRNCSTGHSDFRIDERIFSGVHLLRDPIVYPSDIASIKVRYIGRMAVLGGMVTRKHKFEGWVSTLFNYQWVNRWKHLQFRIRREYKIEKYSSAV